MAVRVGDDIPGWFDWHAHTDAAVASAPPGATLVEVGVFCGKSLAYLADRARAADKGLRVVGVDTFRGSPEHMADPGLFNIGGRPLSDYPVGTLMGVAMAYLGAAGVLDDVTLVTCDSAAAAPLFADGSVWSVFLDGDHSEAGVVRDIKAWWPKVAPGGWLAGDDYGVFPGVAAAVDRLTPGRAVAGRTWVTRVG